MLENLRTSVQPYGGDLFLLLIALAVISLAVLFNLKARLPVDQLRRVIRMAALVALLGTAWVYWVPVVQGGQAEGRSAQSS